MDTGVSRSAMTSRTTGIKFPSWASSLNLSWEGRNTVASGRNGRSEGLLRARQKRFTGISEQPSALEPTASSELQRKQDELNVKADITRWGYQGLQGYRSCLRAQGLCKVVVPLTSPSHPDPVLTRYTAILMVPDDAPDSAYGLLVSGIERSRLP